MSAHRIRPPAKKIAAISGMRRSRAASHACAITASIAISCAIECAIRSLHRRSNAILPKRKPSWPIRRIRRCGDSPIPISAASTRNFPDFWRDREWKREFDGYVAHKNLPSLSLVRFMTDHTGDFDHRHRRRQHAGAAGGRQRLRGGRARRGRIEKPLSGFHADLRRRRRRAGRPRPCRRPPQHRLCGGPLCEAGRGGLGSAIRRSTCCARSKTFWASTR